MWEHISFRFMFRRQIRQLRHTTSSSNATSIDVAVNFALASIKIRLYSLSIQKALFTTHNLKVFNLSKQERISEREREPISSHCVGTHSPLSFEWRYNEIHSQTSLQMYSQFSILNWFSFSRLWKCSSFTWKDLIFPIPFYIYHAIL